MVGLMTRRSGVPRASLAVLMVATVAAAPAAHANDTHVHVEVDPLPFILGGYGVQVGVAHARLAGWRFGLGNFSLDVPDFAAQLNDANDGFHLRVRRSHALYGLYFFSGVRGWCAGGSLRYLRLEYTHDDFANEHARVGELSVEAIGGYKWHPTSTGFYVMPWIAIARPLVATKTAEVGDKTYKADFVQLFATANIGWEL